MGNVLKSGIERALQTLLGMPLTDMWRISRFGLQRFEFGEQRIGKNRRGETVTYGSCFLHVACGWRIVTAGAIIIGKDDYNGTQQDEPYPLRLDPDNPEPDVFAQRTFTFFDRLHDNPPVVEVIEADAIGGVRFTLSGAYRLEILPLESGAEEHWRLLYRDKRKRQFVVTGQGIQGHNGKAQV